MLDALRIDAADLASSLDLGHGQSLTWLSSAHCEDSGDHLFLYFCDAPDEDEEIVLTRHASDLTLIDCAGPYRSFLEAKKLSGIALEDWVDE